MFHFGNWSQIDCDCCQYIRNDGNIYEMIQLVWLDTTEEDRQRGYHEYCVVNGTIDLNDYYEEEIECYISSYGYTMDSLKDEYGDDAMWSIIAECILEEEIIRDGCIVQCADSFEEAKEIIEKFIEEQ